MLIPTRSAPAVLGHAAGFAKIGTGEKPMHHQRDAYYTPQRQQAHGRNDDAPCPKIMGGRL